MKKFWLKILVRWIKVRKVLGHRALHRFIWCGISVIAATIALAWLTFGVVIKVLFNTKS